MLSIFPSHIRAYILVLITLICAYFHMKHICNEKITSKWIALWGILSTIAFLSGNIWWLILAIMAISLYKIPKLGTERIPYYLALLPALPALPYEIPGAFGIRFIFMATYHRLLAIFLLLPLFTGIYRKSLAVNKYIKSGIIASRADTFLVLYVLWLCLLTSRDETLTSSLRSVFYIIIDIVLPYFMMSRCINSLKDFYTIFLALLFSAIALSYAGIIEEIMHWKFYNRLPKQLDLDSFGVARYRSRSGFMRISTTANNPISFGYFIVLAIGAVFHINYVKNIKKRIFLATSLLLIIALFFTFSRGAWLSAIALIIVYLYVKKAKYIKTIVIAFGMFGGILLLFSPVNNLNSIDEHGTFEYRQELIRHSIIEIQNNFISGSNDYMNSENMEEMRQGEGIIDVVNTYLQISLQYGIIGLSLFFFIFVFILKRIFTLIGKFRQKGEKEAELLGCTIFSMILATMLMIGTTSSIDIIPIYYWILLGIGSAYIRVNRP